jgi:membrane-associated phospholipid phosphatase
MAVTGARRRVTGRQLTAAAAAFAGVAVLASAADRGWLAEADRRAFESVRTRRSPAATRVAHAVSALAEPAVAYPVLVLAGVAAARRDGWWRAGVPCLAVAAGAMARRRLSRLIARQRPPVAAWLIEPEGFSLPSKHTTLAVLTVGAAARALGVRGGPARAATMLTATGIGASRVYLGVHWPTDVIAGWLFAEGWLRVTHRG